MHFSISCGLSFMCVAVLLFLPAQGQRKHSWPQRPVIPTSSNGVIGCCLSVSTARIREAVSACYEQKDTFSDCKTHAYIFNTASDQFCVDPNASWLPDRLKKLKRRGINCEIL